MALSGTVRGERVHIGFFGIRNAGKSSVVNAVTGQNLCIVSDVLGTTTDPVKKSMELLPIGSVVIVDTPGIDDDGELGKLRVEKAISALDYVDIAVLVTDADRQTLRPTEAELIKEFERRKTPYIIARNKADLLKSIPTAAKNEIFISALTGYNIYELKEAIGKISREKETEKPIVSDLLGEGDVALLIVPIDKAAPKGRLILPQMQTIRDLLDHAQIPVVCRETELTKTLEKLKNPPKIAVTDSQVFGYVAKNLPREIPLTSFSMLFARYKGNLDILAKGAFVLDNLKGGERILISEGCTHHRQCNDIGTVKLPGWIKDYTKKDFVFDFTSGTEFPTDLRKYALIIHCGGCMLNEKEMKSRIQRAVDLGVPITNYGVAIAFMHGILKRALEPFKIF